jgi:hypothetical protein
VVRAADDPTVRRLVVILAVTALMAASASAALAGTGAKTPRVYKNCTALNAKYPHGIGKAKARDRTTGTPVTTFRRSTKLYNTAMSYNRGLDRDKDGVACESD